MVARIHRIETWKKVVKREGNQVRQVMIKLINNDKFDKLKLNNNEVDKKKKTLEEKKENQYSEEKVD